MCGATVPMAALFAAYFIFAFVPGVAMLVMFVSLVLTSVLHVVFDDIAGMPEDDKVTGVLFFIGFIPLVVLSISDALEPCWR